MWCKIRLNTTEKETKETKNGTNEDEKAKRRRQGGEK